MIKHNTNTAKKNKMEQYPAVLFQLKILSVNWSSSCTRVVPGQLQLMILWKSVLESKYSALIKASQQENQQLAYGNKRLVDLQGHILPFFSWL